MRTLPNEELVFFHICSECYEHGPDSFSSEHEAWDQQPETCECGSVDFEIETDTVLS